MSTNPSVLLKDLNKLSAMLEQAMSDFNKSQKMHWDQHHWKFATNETDSLAFCAYATAIQSVSAVTFTPNSMWKRWECLSSQNRELLYRKVPELYASINAEKVFLQERATIQIGHYGYSAEQHQLRESWKKLSGLEKLFYVRRAREERSKYEEDPENRFRGNYDLSAFNVTTADDANSQLTSRFPWSPFAHDETSAFIFYMETKRPFLVKHPEFAKKRFWEVNRSLLKAWEFMDEKKRQEYADMADRFVEISSKLKAWQITASDVYFEEMRSKSDQPCYIPSMTHWKNVDAEKKKEYAKIALENRKVFLKKYPDLDKYYVWTRSEEQDIVTDDAPETPKSAIDKELKEAIQHYLTMVPEYVPNDVYHRTHDYNIYGNSADRNAFREFVRCATLMTSSKSLGGLMDSWAHFIQLSDKERDVFYNEVQKKNVLSEARRLFTADNCPVARNEESRTNQDYAKQMPLMYQKWESLSALCKQYYSDIAEKNLLQSKQENSKFCSHLTAKEALNEPRAYPANKISFEFTVNRSSDYTKACMVYMKKKVDELSKEPEMAGKRHFQLNLILGLRFANLSDEERKPYFDYAQRIMEIDQFTQDNPVTEGSMQNKKLGHFTYYPRNMSDEDRASCGDEALQNRLKLLEEFPDVDEYFHWVLTNSPVRTIATATRKMVPVTDDKNSEGIVRETAKDNAQSGTSPEAQTQETEEDKKKKITTNESVESSFEVVSKDETSETQEVTMEEKDAEANFIESADSNVEIVSNVLETSEKPESTATNGTAETESKKLSGSWEFINDEQNAQEEADLKCDDENATNVSENNQNQQATAEESISTKKAPTAFMFYKKAMRRQVGKDYGKDPVQREKLISDWKNLNDEAKAVYFEQKRLARLQLQ